MSAFVHISFPDEPIHWFAGELAAGREKDRHPAGPCPHTCTHQMQSVVAWGPNFEHYELVRCDDAEGCAGMCRGWQPTDGNPIGLGGKKYRDGVSQFMLMDRALQPHTPTVLKTPQSV